MIIGERPGTAVGGRRPSDDGGGGLTVKSQLLASSCPTGSSAVSSLQEPRPASRQDLERYFYFLSVFDDHVPCAASAKLLFGLPSLLGVVRFAKSGAAAGRG